MIMLCTWDQVFKIHLQTRQMVILSKKKFLIMSSVIPVILAFLLYMALDRKYLEYLLVTGSF